MLLPLTVGAVNLPSFDVNVLVPVQELPEPPLVLEVPGLVSEKKLNPCDDELLDEDDELPDDDEDDEDEPFLLLGASAIAPISTAAMTMPPPLAISTLPVGDSSGALVHTQSTTIVTVGAVEKLVDRAPRRLFRRRRPR